MNAVQLPEVTGLSIGRMDLNLSKVCEAVCEARNLVPGLRGRSRQIVARLPPETHAP